MKADSHWWDRLPTPRRRRALRAFRDAALDLVTDGTLTSEEFVSAMRDFAPGYATKDLERRIAGLRKIR